MDMREKVIPYWPECLTRREAIQIISEGVGKPIHFVELTKEQAIQQWQEQGYQKKI